MAKRRPAKKKPTAAELARVRTLEKLRRYVRSQGEGHLEDLNISSIGVGYKLSNGKRSKNLCLQFTVRTKGTEPGVMPEGIETEPIPATIMVEGEEIPTDILERDFEASFKVVQEEALAEDLNFRKMRQDPLVPGISVAHPDGTAGTLGLIVYDKLTGAPCMLSNWHVLHTADGEIGDVVVQPGPFDNNDITGNSAGSLLRSHLGQAGDCAIARIEDREFTTDIYELDKTPTQIAEVELDDRVIKSGRTTGVTRGIVRRIDVLASIFYPGVGSVAIGGFEIEPLPGAGSSHEISMGGDSGSAWMILRNGNATDIFAGLHFAGESGSNPDEHALACYPKSVFKKLQISLAPLSEEEARSTRGYDRNFLRERVNIPWLSDATFADTVKVDGTHRIPYTHFSVVQSMTRKLPRLVAWNIDGGRIKRVSRRGIDFRLDRRVPRQFQAGNELYRNNPLDRGHVARRADLTWGTIDEARQANRDSFFFTNITPQHESFNQSPRGGLWGRLENAILDEVEVEDLKISVLAGPIFSSDDPEHRGVQVPREYWKMVAYGDTQDSKFKVQAFVLTQKDLIRNLEALDLDPFRMFQVSLTDLGDMIDMDFGGLTEFDTFTRSRRRSESIAMEAREIASVSEIAG